MRAPIKCPWPIMFLVLVGLSCEREGPVGPGPDSTPMDGRDRFVGSYAVYDTTGAYLYGMTISEFGSGGRDSLLVVNFADTFDLRILHESYWTTNYLDYSFFPAVDQAGHRWALFGASIEDGSNVLRNDTIPLKFTLSNIAFYWEEGVPYYSCVCKQIAVKQ